MGQSRIKRCIESPFVLSFADNRHPKRFVFIPDRLHFSEDVFILGEIVITQRYFRFRKAILEPHQMVLHRLADFLFRRGVAFQYLANPVPELKTERLDNSDQDLGPVGEIIIHPFPLDPDGTRNIVQRGIRVALPMEKILGRTQNLLAPVFTAFLDGGA